MYEDIDPKIGAIESGTPGLQRQSLAAAAAEIGIQAWCGSYRIMGTATLLGKAGVRKLAEFIDRNSSGTEVHP